MSETLQLFVPEELGEEAPSPPSLRPVPVRPVPIRAVPSTPPARQWTSSQLSAIASRARTLVTAAAGSGKTSVLTELVTQALVAREVAPSQVCAVTFTEKAAQEMRGRIADRLEALGERDLLSELELARIGTIHSLCSTILRAHGAAVGIDPGVAQLDEAQHAWILREAYEHSLDALGEDTDVHWLRARMGDDRLEVLLRGIHGCAAQGDGSARLPEPQDVAALVDPGSGETLVSAPDARRAVAAIARVTSSFHREVEQRKQALGAISFDDLERLAVEAVRIPAVRTALRARWGMLLVDEFQDTNARQYELLDAIGTDRLFMVGDEWQSIYRFRGADVDVFRARRDDASGAAVVPMRENFRSDAPVLEVVNRVFASEALFGDRYEPVHPGTAAQRDVVAPSVELLIAPAAEELAEPGRGGVTPREREALCVAERIAELVESGQASPGDVALLYARGTGVDVYERALGAWGLPVLRAASGGYYDQRDVRDVLALLSVVRNRADEFAAIAALAGPVGRLTWTELSELVRESRLQADAGVLAVAHASLYRGAQRVLEVIAHLSERAERGSLVDLVAAATQLPELEVGAASESDGPVRVANLRRLVELAASAEAVGVRGVARFLEFVAAQRRDARTGEASIADEGSGAIRMLTVHASKGLEFPHVFVIEAASAGGGRSGLVPRPLCDPGGVVHVAVPRHDGRCVPTPELAELQSIDADAEREESLRLWYVAMTRAQRKLYVTARWDFRQTKAGKPRSVPGALCWLREAIGLDDDLGGENRTYLALDGLVRVDTRPARRVPEAVWLHAQQHQQLATPLELPSAGVENGQVLDAAPDRHALRAALQDAVAAARSDDRRQLDGTRIHDAVARLIDAARSGTPLGSLLDPVHGPWLVDSVRARLAPVVGSRVLQRLVRLGARTEVPYVAGSGASVASRAVPGIAVASSVAAVDAGRMDAVAVLPDGAWWVVDWKSTLPPEQAQTWLDHGEQMIRYVQAAVAAGAPAAIVTLVPLDRPDDTITWRIEARDAQGTWPRPEPEPAGLP